MEKNMYIDPFFLLWIICLDVFNSVLWCPLRIPRKNDVRIVFNSIVLFMLFIYIYWCPKPFIFQEMFFSFNGNMTDATNGAGAAYPSGAPQFAPVFHKDSSYSIYIVFCRLFLLSFFPFTFNYCSVCPSDYPSWISTAYIDYA